nr:gustatory receptor 14 [Papilio dardanus]
MQTNNIIPENNVITISRICDTLKPLHRLLKLFSLNCNKDNQISSKPTCYLISKSILMAIILATLTISSLYWKITQLYGEISVSIKITDAIQTVYDLCQYLVDISFVLVYGRDMSFEYFKQYGRLDNIMGMNYNSEVKLRLIKLIAFFAFIWAISSMCDFTAWVLTFGWLAPFVYSIAYVYLLIKILTTLDLISQVMQIECRLRCLADLLLTCYCGGSKEQGFVEDCAFKYNWFYPSKVGKDTNPLKKVGSNITDEIKWVRKYYLLLIGQCAFINKMYGMRILLNSLSLLIDMVRFTNIAVRYIIISQKTVETDYLPTISSLMRLLTCAAVVISLVHHCEKAYRERDRIICILDHYLVINDPSNEVRSALNILRDLVQSRAITFHMAYFFRFDYSLLVSMASVVVTYTIIILQSVN